MLSTGQVDFRQITVRQPSADLLVCGPAEVEAWSGIRPWGDRLPKDVENRPFGTQWRGVLLIHAGKDPDIDAMRLLDLNRSWFIYQAVIGVVVLRDVRTQSGSWWARPGAKHWVVDRPFRLSVPVGCRGFQGIRTPERGVLDQVLEQLDEAGYRYE